MLSQSRNGTSELFWGHVWGHGADTDSGRASANAGLKALLEAHRSAKHAEQEPHRMGLFSFSRRRISK